jgi:hypothetical protein
VQQGAEPLAAGISISGRTDAGRCDFSLRQSIPSAAKARMALRTL